MLKNEKLVLKMSVEQKVQLITSATKYQNDQVGSCEFPVFDLSVDQIDKANEFYTTAFPSDKSLACTFNPKLIKSVYKAKGTEANMCVANPFFNTGSDLIKQNISRSSALTGQVLSSKIQGLNEVNALVNFESSCPSKEDIISKEINEIITSSALKKAYLKSAWIANEEDIENLLIKYKRQDLYFATASSKEEVVKLLNKRCNLVFLDNVDLDELKNYVNECIARFEEAHSDLEENIISKEEFESLFNEETFINPETINELSDEMISLLLELSDSQDKLTEEPIRIENGNTRVLFDEKAHEELSYKAAKESVVLLKNEKILPLDRHLKVAVIGECAKNNLYFVKEEKQFKDNFKMPFEEINDYDINTTGFAYGYLKGQVDDEETIASAVALAKDADYALLYLYAGAKETTLPTEQLQLIEELVKENVKIIAVVSADNTLDLSFEKYCDAVIFTYSTSQHTAKAVLDVIVGAECPSGRLSFDGLVYVDEKPIIKYPFGHGLSYTTFHYYNLEVNEKGIKCTVTNTGNYDAYTVLQLYVTYKNATGLFAHKSLRGFKKIFVRRNESLKVEIPFDNNTFKSYDPKIDHYCIKAGEYELTLAESLVDEKLKGVVKLADYIFDDKTYHAREIDTSNDFEHAFAEFADSKDKRDFKRERRGLPFGLKLGLAIFLTIYFTVIAIIFLLSDIAQSSSPIFGIFALVLAIVVNVIGIINIVKISRKQAKLKRLDVNDTLTNIVDKVKLFNELGKITYELPVEQEQEEEQAEEVVEEVVEEVEKKYESEFEVEEDDVVYKENVSFGELCANFHDYAVSKGVEVEIASIRSLFAAISSSKITFMNVANKIALPLFLEVFNSYFGNNGFVKASPAWTSLKDLLWKDEGHKYVASEFTKVVHQATNDNKRNFVALIDNVDLDHLMDYFAKFVQFANHPTEEFELVLNEEMTIQLPKNVSYVLVPTDGSYVEKLNRDLVSASAQIDLVISNCEPSKEDVEVKTVSYEDLADLVRHAREAHYLPEKIWKKLDELVETINLSERFHFGNKNTLQVEKLSAVLIECGGDESEAFAFAFLSKIVPLLKTTKIYRKEQGEKTLFNLIEKGFADEDVTKIQKALAKKN